MFCYHVQVTNSPTAAQVGLKAVIGATWLALALAAAPGRTAAPANEAECTLQLLGYGSKGQPGVQAASLSCTVTSNGVQPIVGVDETYMKQHAVNFTGVQVLPRAQLPCQKKSTEVMALLYFCGNYSMSFKQLSMRDVWLPPNKDKNNTLVLFGEHVQANLSDSSIRDNHAGTCLWLRDRAELALNNVQVLGNYGRQSVAVRVQDKAQLTARNSMFARNNATDRAGAISAHNFATITLMNCSVSHNKAGTSGGGMYVEHDSNVTFIDSIVGYNTAGTSSGAFYLSATINLLHSQVVSNTVLDKAQGEAGVARMMNDGLLNVMQNSLISNNSAYYGGCVYVWENCKVVIDNSTVVANEGRFGGFGYIRGFAIVTVRNNSTIFNNSAFSGGFVNAFAASNVYVANSTFSSNKATYGGALFVEGANSSVTIMSGRFVSNTASSGGGACHSAMSARVKLGGDPGSTADFVNNTAVQGGAIFARDFSTVTLLDGSVLSNNTASKVGGAVFAQESAGISMRAGSMFSKNTAVYGGGAYLQDSSNATIGGLLSGNQALKDGGGLLTADNVSLVVESGAQFTGNRAQGMGGGLYLGTSHFVPVEVQQAVAPNNQAMFSPGFAASTTNFTLLTNHTVNGFVSRLGAAEGILHADLNVTGHFGLPSDGMLVQAMLLDHATGVQTFLGSNRSVPTGIASLSVKVRKPPGAYIVRYSLVSDYDTGIKPVDITLQVRPCERGEVTPAPDACDVCPINTYR